MPGEAAAMKQGLTMPDEVSAMRQELTMIRDYHNIMASRIKDLSEHVQERSKRWNGAERGEGAMCPAVTWCKELRAQEGGLRLMTLACSCCK